MIEIVTALGFATALCAGWGAILLALIGLCKLSSIVSLAIKNHWKGWKTFREFRKWYAENKAIGETK